MSYDASERAIYVRFHGGVVYQYENCESNVWEELIDPDISLGIFISNELDRYPYRRTR